MLMTKLSYIGAAGLGLMLAFGGVRTLAFQGPGEVRPVRIASEFAQRPAGKDEAPKTPTAVEPTSRDGEAELLDRIERVATTIANYETSIEQMKSQLAVMKERLEKMRRARDEARRQPPAGVPAPGAATPPSGVAARKKADDTVEGEKPSYINMNMGRIIVVISPDGSRIAAYDVESGKSRPVRLPEIRGVRREVIVHASDPRMAWGQQRSKAQMEGANSPWLYALDLDRDRKVTRIAALNAMDGTWIDQAIPEPVDRSAVKLSQGGVFRIGHRLYGLSTAAKRWGVFELSPGAPENTSVSGNPHWAERDGRLFRFNPKTADWEDIYARAIEDKPAETPK